MSSLSVILQADTSGFTSAIERAKKLLELYTLKNKELADQIKSSTGVTDEQVNSYKRVIKLFEKISSGSMTVTQQEKALANQIKELKIQWQNLSETAKSSDFGKAISLSTRAAQEQLKQLRTLMKAVSTDMEDSSGKVEKLSGKLDTNLVSSIVSLAGKLGILAGALKVAKDAFLATETGADQWGLAVAGALSAYKVFLTTLNNGDWSNFFRNLNDAIGGAIELYNAFDDLESIKTNNQVAIAITERTLAELRLKKELGKNVDEEIKKEEERLAKLRQLEIDAGRKAGRGGIIQSIKEQNAQADADIINNFVNDLFENGDEALKDIKNKFQELEDKVTTKIERILTTSWGGTTHYTDEVKAIDKLNKEELKLYHTYKAIVESELDWKKGLAAAKAAEDLAKQTNQDLYKYNKWGNNKNTTNTTTEEKIVKTKFEVEPILIGRTEKQIKEDIKKIQEKIDNTPNGALRILLQALKEDLEKELENLNKTPVQIEIEAKAKNLDLSGVKNASLEIGVGDKSEVLKKNAEGINEMLSSSERLYSVWNRIGDSFDNGNIIEQFFAISNAISSTIDSVQNLISGFLKVGEAVQMLQEIYSSASQLKIQEDNAETASNLTKASSASTAAIAEGTHKAVSTSKTWQEVIIAIAAVISAITAALALAGKFANGGIIQGKTTIGDYNLARVNSGEMILNLKQQGRLFKMLNGSINQPNNNITGDVNFKIEGSNLVGVLNNYNRKRSKI